MTANHIIDRYGQAAVLTNVKTKKSVHFKALVQALRYKNKLYLRGTYTELGRNQQDCYLYIGPPEVDITDADSSVKTLTVGGTPYIVDRVEKHYIGEKLIYYWAIVHPFVSDES